LLDRQASEGLWICFVQRLETPWIYFASSQVQRGPAAAGKASGIEQFARKRAAHLQKKTERPHRTPHKIITQGFGPFLAFAAGQVCSGAKHASWS